MLYPIEGASARTRFWENCSCCVLNFWQSTQVARWRSTAGHTIGGQGFQILLEGVGGPNCDLDFSFPLSFELGTRRLIGLGDATADGAFAGAHDGGDFLET